MAEPLNQRLKKVVVCSICLERFENPKQLKCYHHFCKQCLEGIINFNRDGSGNIVCPLRCTTETWIGVNETVNDLPASYELKSMLEVFDSEEDPNEVPISKCKYSEKCNKTVSMYCCGKLLCKACNTEHRKQVVEDRQHRKTVELLFCRKDNKLKILCEKHLSGCTHICSDNALLCLYCLKREKAHKNHRKTTIEAEAESIKEKIVFDSKEKENIQKFADCTRASIETIKSELEETLKARKEECLRQYTEFLNKEGERLKKEFDTICNEHLTQYMDNVLEDKLFPDKKRETDIEFVLEKDELLSTVAKSKKSLLKSDIIGLSERFHFMAERPLGQLHTSQLGELLTTFLPVPTLIYHRPSDCLSNSSAPESDVEVPMLTDLAEEGPSSDGAHDGNILDNPGCSSSSSGRRTSSLSPLQFGTVNLGSDFLGSATSNRVQVFLDIVIDGAACGRVVINLYNNVVPKTCLNFLQLCTHQQGFGYKGSRFHYLNPDRYIVGGDITTRDGNGGRSIYGDKFECENFQEKHDDKGVLSMVNCGGFVKSMFFITTKAMPGNDGHNVVFGKVTDDTFHVVESMAAVGGKHQPSKDVLIVNSGVV